MSEPTVIAILGAECTGKSSLAEDLGAALAASGHDVAVVPEYLRVFCDTHGRTPRADEQRAIARVQTARIQAAAARHAVVIADTTALITAVYSDLIFGDASLYDESVLAHLGCRVNLLAATDIPGWPMAFSATARMHASGWTGGCVRCCWSGACRSRCWWATRPTACSRRCVRSGVVPS